MLRCHGGPDVILAFCAMLSRAAGGCGPEFRVHQYSIADPSPSSVCAYDPSAPGNVTFNPAGGLGPASPSYSCPTKRMNSGSMWLGIMVSGAHGRGWLWRRRGRAVHVRGWVVVQACRGGKAASPGWCVAQVSPSFALLNCRWLGRLAQLYLLIQ